MIKGTIEDHLEFEQLFARYVHAIDDGHAEDWASLFTPDAVFNFGGQTQTGTDGLIRMAQGLFEVQKDRLRHTITNILIDEIEGQTAKVRAYGLVTVWEATPLLSDFAIYTVRLRKVGGDWKLEQVDVRLPVRM